MIITKQFTNRESKSLDQYLQEIGKVNLLTPDEEVDLAIKIRKGDGDAQEKLVRANLRFVVSVAKQFQNKGQEYRVERQATDREIDDMLFGWAVEHGVTSNSVLYIKDGCTVGIGTGEQDRVGVAEIAVHKAYIKYADIVCFDKHGIPYADLALEVKQGKRDKADQDEIDAKTMKDKADLPGSVMISDAFFPFRDGADVGIEQGVSAILQAGGSMNDYQTIQACNEADPQVAMMFTGQRSFKH